ncbi:MAG: hypothetical protein IT374_13420 [Polyangiaceae bacterium]|nr:hypothetical protein [Polyangiaceae bacterium]
MPLLNSSLNLPSLVTLCPRHLSRQGRSPLDRWWLSDRVRAYWGAIATWLKRDRRLARLVGAYRAYRGAPIDLLPTGTELQMKRRGEDERFSGSKLRVPSGTLRDRREDVLSPEVLVRRHAGYRNRVLMGPSFRADVWTALEHAPDLSIADIARKSSCSFATAWQAAQDGGGRRPAGPDLHMVWRS